MVCPVTAHLMIMRIQADQAAPWQLTHHGHFMSLGIMQCTFYTTRLGCHIGLRQLHFVNMREMKGFCHRGDKHFFKPFYNKWVTERESSFLEL